MLHKTCVKCRHSSCHISTFTPRVHTFLTSQTNRLLFSWLYSPQPITLINIQLQAETGPTLASVGPATSQCVMFTRVGGVGYTSGFFLQTLPCCRKIRTFYEGHIHGYLAGTYINIFSVIPQPWKKARPNSLKTAQKSPPVETLSSTSAKIPTSGISVKYRLLKEL